jgi:hypothetical protein
MLLSKLGGFWLLPPRDFPHHLHNESHPMDYDSVSSGHTKSKDPRVILRAACIKMIQHEFCGRARTAERLVCVAERDK